MLGHIINLEKQPAGSANTLTEIRKLAILHGLEADYLGGSKTFVKIRYGYQETVVFENCMAAINSSRYNPEQNGDLESDI